MEWLQESVGLIRKMLQAYSEAFSEDVKGKLGSLKEELAYMKFLNSLAHCQEHEAIQAIGEKSNW